MLFLLVLQFHSLNNRQSLELTQEIIHSERIQALERETHCTPLNLHTMILWNASRSLYKEKFTKRLPARHTGQWYGPFGIKIDEVTDSANIEQLGIILQYVFEGKPRERLFEYIDCDRTTGEELCNSIFKVFEKSPFYIKDCRSQTMDGAANKSGREKAPLVVYNYCANQSRTW